MSPSANLLTTTLLSLFQTYEALETNMLKPKGFASLYLPLGTLPADEKYTSDFLTGSG